jgi:xylulokinase
MTKTCVLTIDVGTSGTKTAVWRDGARIGEASRAYALTRPQATHAEISAESWWDAVVFTVREAIGQSKITPHEIAGIGVDGIGWTLVSVDKNCAPLHPAIIWLDRRAEAEAAHLRGLPIADELVRLCANPLDAGYITPKLLWLKKNHPDVFDAAHMFLTCSGYITAKLTGHMTCDFTQAYGYHFFDISRERWDENAAHALGIPLEKMPRLMDCAEIAGGLTPQAAAQLGLVEGIPVIAGCLDAAAGALGAGVTRVGHTNEQGGQAGGMAICLNKIVVEPRLIFSHHVLRGQYLLQGGTVGGGSLVWFRDVFDKDGSFEEYSRLAATAPPGANGLIFVPYMAGERTPLWNSNARGIFFGLSYATTRADMLRAIMEGCAFAVNDNIQIAAQSGAEASEYLGSGGATHSAVWCQIKADVYGKPLVVAQCADGSEGGHLLGLYALTAQAVGLCANAGALVDGLLTRRAVYQPSPGAHAFYKTLFEVYLNVSRKMLPEFEKLAEIERKKK